MRPLINQTVEELAPPGDAALSRARQAPASPIEHARFLEEIEAFHALEHRAPRQPPGWTGRLRIAAFNGQRLKAPLAARALVERAGADLVLLSEADVGMARSGNVHTIRELIGPSNDGYLYGVEFVELDLGDREEMHRHAGARNARSLHGNAIVTPYALEDPCLIPLEDGGLWFPGWEGAQRRIGRRIALAARVAAAPRPLWVVALHLESKTDPAARRAQIQALLRALDSLAPNEACVIGGDFNTKALAREEEQRPMVLEAPERFEPLFEDLRSAGFDWVGANLSGPTQRTGPSGKPPPPLGKLDWIVARGVLPENPRIVPAVDNQGRPVSDHEMIAVDLRL